MRVTKTAVIQAASDIADEKGLNNVSLKVVAERLNIRTPSLYNHIENLDDLLLRGHSNTTPKCIQQVGIKNICVADGPMTRSFIT